jgi:hypothetical protein
MKKESIANYADRLGHIAFDIGQQLHKSKVTLKEKYFLGLLARHAVILRDIKDIIASRDLNAQTSTFILFRCLLDDFITLLYFQSRDFQESDLISHTANAFNKKFKMLKESVSINEKYFNGSLQDLANTTIYDQEVNEFCQNTDNHIFFKDAKKRSWKTFINTSEIVRQLPRNGISAANAHALVLWQLLSNYIHYSAFTYMLETSPESRKIEIIQLKEALSYSYKSIVIASHVLNKYGLVHELKDPTNLKDELMEGYRQAEEEMT